MAAQALSYQVLSQSHRIEFEEKRSRFICYLEPVDGREQALAFLESLRLKYPDARHHCWVYQTGNPQSPNELAFSDDGEPAGTAAKPMMQVLQYRGLSHCMAVVVRYFGGIKLGAGGLVRAYSSSVQQAVESARDAGCINDFVEQAQFCVLCDFADEAKVRHLLEGFQASIANVSYSAKARLECVIRQDQLSAFETQLINASQGRAELSITEDHQSL